MWNYTEVFRGGGLFSKAMIFVIFCNRRDGVHANPMATRTLTVTRELPTAVVKTFCNITPTFWIYAALNAELNPGNERHHKTHSTVPGPHVPCWSPSIAFSICHFYFGLSELHQYRTFKLMRCRWFCTASAPPCLCPLGYLLNPTINQIIFPPLLPRDKVYTSDVLITDGEEEGRVEAGLGELNWNPQAAKSNCLNSLSA